MAEYKIREFGDHSDVAEGLRSLAASADALDNQILASAFSHRLSDSRIASIEGIANRILIVCQELRKL